MTRKILYGFLGFLVCAFAILFLMSVFEFAALENQVFGVPADYVNIVPWILVIIGGLLGVWGGVRLAAGVNKEPKEKADPLKPKVKTIETILLAIVAIMWALWDSLGSTQLSSGINRLLLFAWLVISVQPLYYSKRKLSPEEKEGEAKISVTAPFLSTKEKLWIWIPGLISPPIVGLMSFFAWRKDHYLKARQANFILLSIASTELLLAFLIGLGIRYGW